MKQKNTGFTLIEIITVVTIIGLLLSGSLFYIGSVRAGMRDTQRVNDISQMHSALELYYQQHGYYPAELVAGQPLTSDDGSVVYLEEIPSNPQPRDDGDCVDEDYIYESLGYEYHLFYCLGTAKDHIAAGKNVAVPKEIACTPINCDGMQCGESCTKDCGECVCTISFDGNGSTSGLMSDQVFDYNTSDYLSPNSYTKDGYTFAGWHTLPDGSDNYSGGTAYDDQAWYYAGFDDEILYAQWEIDCDDSITFRYNGSTVTYGIVASNNRCWLDRNLGASRVATAYNDNWAYGDYFQWGRLDNGHQSKNSDTTSNKISTDVLKDGTFIIPTSSPNDWRDPQNNNLWQGVAGTNNPCPAGFRLPTGAEWEAERDSWRIRNAMAYNAEGAYGSPLKLTVGGVRRWYSGSVGNAGSFGYYWSSSAASKVSYLIISTTYAQISESSQRANGRPVRCIRE